MGETIAGGPCTESTEFRRQVAAMLHPDTYPVRVGRIRAVPTHMAVVFLTEHHAWKLRRPARHGQIDFHDRRSRWQAARSEWALDAHFAPGVCLGIARLQSHGPRWELYSARSGDPAHLGAHEGEPVVCMHRLPARGFMDQMMLSGRLQPHHIKALLNRFIQQHRWCPRAELSLDQVLASAKAGQAAALETLRQAPYGQPTDLIDEIDVRLHASQDRLAPLIASRLRAGHVRHGHGDLRPEHVALEGARASLDGPLFIDALEFSARLRQRDVLEELAGLAVECEFLGARRVSDALRAAGLIAATRSHRQTDTVAGRTCRLWFHHAAVRAVNRALHAAGHLHPPGVSDGADALTLAAVGPAAAPVVDRLRPVRDWRARTHRWLLLASSQLTRAEA
jgi:aminoglycoside phosphotransferase family enzyme